MKRFIDFLQLEFNWSLKDFKELIKELKVLLNKWRMDGISKEELVILVPVVWGSSIFFFMFISSAIIWFGFFKMMQFEFGFIETSTALAESLVDLYNFVWIFLNFTLVLVFVALSRILYLCVWNVKILKFENFGKIYNLFFEYYYENKYNLLGYDFLLPIPVDFYKLSRILNNKLKFNIFYLNYERNDFLIINDVNEHKKLEIIWSLLPASILLILIGPTFSLIFSLDPDIDPVFTIKVIGQQWYWTYELYGVYNNGIDGKNLFNFDFDSYMVSENDLEVGQLRLLEVDKKLVLPVCLPIRFVVTAADVLHSWAVPSLGIKVDAVPGRLNQFLVEIKRPGIFYGQCSELCGPMHAFMPIVIQALELKEFEVWLNNLSQ